jgi:hypothetical protein
MAITEREHHIKVLEQFLHDYQEWGEDSELEKTIKYAISSLKTDLKYDLLYEGEDVYTKADKMAMLTELQLEIEEVPKYCMTHDGTCVYRKSEEYISDINNVIQQKINALKENKDGKK